MILAKDSVPGKTIHEIHSQLEQLVEFVDKATQACYWAAARALTPPLHRRTPTYALRVQNPSQL